MSKPDKSLVVFGLHACLSTLQRAPQDVLEIWLRAEAASPELVALGEQAKALGITRQLATLQTLDRLANGGVHQGVVLRRRPPAPLDFDALRARLRQSTESPLLLAIDHPQDPHNLGACLRVADGAGVAAVLVPRDRSVGLTAVAAKVASGAADTVPLVQVTNLVRALGQLKEDGLWVVGATHETPLGLYAADLTVPSVLVMGAEGAGLRRLTREACDLLVHIPMLGSVSSLNLSTAAAVCLFEARRQRLVLSGKAG